MVGQHSGLEKQLWPAFTSGKIKVLIHKTLPMQKAAEAQDILYASNNLGKVVLTVNS